MRTLSARAVVFLAAAAILGLLAGCASSHSSHSAVTADYFRVLDLRTCRRVFDTIPATSYDATAGRYRWSFAGDSGVRLDSDRQTVRPLRVDSSGVDPAHCATRAGR